MLNKILNFKTKFSADKKRGFIYATFVTLTQAFEAMIYPLFRLVFKKSLYSSSNFSGAALGAKEIISFFLLFAFFGPKIMKKAVLNLKNKAGRLFALAGGIGTTIGNLFYILGISFAGSGYGIMLTSLFPVFSMIIVRIFIKEKENFKVWIGVMIALIASILFIILPYIVEKKNGFDSDKVIGLIFGMICAFFWTIEGFLIKIGLKINEKKKLNILEQEVIASRTIFTFISTFCFVMPILSLAFKSDYNSFELFVKIFVNWESLIIIFIISINISILRYFHIKAINLLGPKLASTIETNNFWIPSLFIIFLQYLNINSFENENIYQPIEWYSWILVPILLFGILMVVTNIKKHE